MNHPCLQRLTVYVSCPADADAQPRWSLTWALGPQWGEGSWLTAWQQSGDSDLDGRRAVQLGRVDGRFDVRCRVCGLGGPAPLDQDCREGFVDTYLSFGPNSVDGLVDETLVTGYAVVVVDGDCGTTVRGQTKLSAPVAVLAKSVWGRRSSVDLCGCVPDAYRVRVSVALPEGSEAVKFMILPNTSVGLMPVGVTTPLVLDSVCTTTSTLTTTTATATTTTSTTMTTTTTTTTTSTATTSTTTSSTATTSTTSTLTTTTATETQTFTAASGTGPLVQSVEGSFSLDVTNSSSFVSDPAAASAVQKSVASLAGVAASYVSVTLSLAARRLSPWPGPPADARRAQATGRVKVAYTITPPSAEVAYNASTVLAKLAAVTPAIATPVLTAALAAVGGAGSYTAIVQALDPPYKRPTRLPPPGPPAVLQVWAGEGGSSATGNNVTLAAGLVGSIFGLGLVVALAVFVCRRGGLLEARKDGRRGKKGAAAKVLHVAEQPDKLQLEAVAREALEAEVVHEEVYPVLDNGTPVEYWSAAQRRWMPATLEVITSPATPVQPPQVVYNVRVGRQEQLVQDVPMHSFRVPLAAGELVEVPSEGDRTWVPAFVLGGDAVRGYRIRQAPENEWDPGEGLQDFEQVPASRLRRRFPEGTCVLLYKGPVLGWAAGMVVPRLAGDEETYELTGVLEQMGLRGRHWGASVLRHQAPEESDDEGEVLPWCMVRLRELVGETGQPAPEGKLVPSYLVHPLAEEPPEE